ncbi:MAG: valine--tRNA ligase [bacterium]|nr:valine--tRNA ligase [bacterium]
MANTDYQPYNPAQTEPEIYAAWEKGGYFTPKVDPTKKPFTIIMPPPNANGRLHIGHAMFVTVEDILSRWHRMLGEEVLWLPGADHAGILTQVVFERELAKKDVTRHQLGREEFNRQCLAFTLTNKATMEKQLKTLGASCDWTREKFTLDPDLQPAVLLTFKKLFDAGLVYHGNRIISWCSRCATALSDLEVEYGEEQGSLTYIKYPLKDSSEFIIVATTRPETMLGDTAVAVNPDDVRYKKMVGKLVKLPLTDREIPIIADAVVDREFGTGAVKVTPAHDPVDFDIGQRHQLEQISVIGEDWRMTPAAGEKYSSLKIKEAREKVVADLQALGLVEKIEPYSHSVGHCERCKTIVEPLISWQWFIKGKELASAAIEAVKKGETKILPERFEKTYFQWMANIRDWCISRQIWWGIRIPIWYCEKCQETLVGVDEEGHRQPPTKCPKCGSTDGFREEEDTFDTWFSSGQWPYVTLGWPKETADFKYFYPTSVMETGYEILFFWVARMMMLGLFSTGKVPFQTIYLHGLVRDAFGKKMSKSKGNGIDPLEVVAKYGADALRVALIIGSAPGNDMSLGEDKIKGYRNFANKIWNASRFVLTALEKEDNSAALRDVVVGDLQFEEDKTILKELEELTKGVTSSLENYRLSDAASSLYEFFWHRYCDWYIEAIKPRLRSEDPTVRRQALSVLIKVLRTSMLLLHPFMPFVTEMVWGKLGEKEPLVVSAWPLK